MGTVLNGNTLLLDSDEVVMVLGTNAPEVGGSQECFGPEARDALSELLVGKPVRLEFDAMCTDRYGRTLAYVYLTRHALAEEGPSLQSELFVNAWLLRNGYGRWYEAFDDIRLASELQSAEEQARRAEVGLWDSCF